MHHFVELDWIEMLFACATGVMRRLRSIASGYKNVVDQSESETEINNFQKDIEGAIAEACFAKFMGLYWGFTINSFKGPDVGNWQVRGTDCLRGHLIVRRKDKPGFRIALVTVPSDRFGGTVIGWFDTDAAKVDKYWKKDSWWVPQGELHQFDEKKIAA
jgi:hypothetical protein